MLSGDACKVAAMPLNAGIYAIVAPDDGEWWNGLESFDVSHHGSTVRVIFATAESGAPVPHKGTLVRKVIDALAGAKDAYISGVFSGDIFANNVPITVLDQLPTMTMDAFKETLHREKRAKARVITSDRDCSIRCSGHRVSMWDDVPVYFRNLLWPTGIPTYNALA